MLIYFLMWELPWCICKKFMSFVALLFLVTINIACPMNFPMILTSFPIKMTVNSHILILCQQCGTYYLSLEYFALFLVHLYDLCKTNKLYFCDSEHRLPLFIQICKRNLPIKFVYVVRCLVSLGILYKSLNNKNFSFSLFQERSAIARAHAGTRLFLSVRAKLTRPLVS